MTVQRVHQDSLYFGNHWRKQIGLFFQHVSKGMELCILQVLNAERQLSLSLGQMRPYMDHVSLEEMVHWNMIVLTVFSANFGLRLRPRGETDVTHGLRLVLLRILSKVDVISSQLDTNSETIQTTNGEFFFQAEHVCHEPYAILNLCSAEIV